MPQLALQAVLIAPLLNMPLLALLLASVVFLGVKHAMME